MSETMTELMPHGYAPGHYMCKCGKCGAHFEGDKRAITCLTCALPAALSAAEARGREAAADIAQRAGEQVTGANPYYSQGQQAMALEIAAAIRKGLTP